MAGIEDYFDIVGDPNTGGQSPVGGGDMLSLFLAAQGGPLGLGLGVGSKLLSFLGGLGTGKKKKQLFKDVGALISQAMSQKGKPIYDVDDIFAKARVGAQPDIERTGRDLDARFGFDQGRAGKEFTKFLSQFLGGTRSNLETNEALSRSSRDTDLIRLALEGKQLQSSLL